MLRHHKGSKTTVFGTVLKVRCAGQSVNSLQQQQHQRQLLSENIFWLTSVQMRLFRPSLAVLTQALPKRQFGQKQHLVRVTDQCHRALKPFNGVPVVQIAIIIFFTVFASVTSAQSPVPGSQDPRFVEATDAWLNGDELEALKELSSLANEGHVPAKILVSRIADTPWFSAHISQTLNRRERIALFRDPTGLSGRDWLASASEEHELARAMWETQSYVPPDIPDFEMIVPTLASHGESKILLRYFIETWIFGREEVAVRVLLENDALFGAAGRDFLGFAILSMVQNGKQPPLPVDIKTADQARAFVAWLRQDIHQFAFSGLFPVDGGRVAVPTQPDGLVALAVAVQALPELQPLTLFCEATCEVQEQQACLADTVWLVSQAGAFPYPFSSPAQSLIPDETYWSSGRLFSDIGRNLERQDWQGCR